MEKIRVLDLVTRKHKAMTIGRDKLCVGPFEYSEYLGLPSKCIPITPSAVSQIYKIAMPTSDGLMALGFILPDTVRLVESTYVLFSFSSVRVVTVLFDVRTATRGVIRDNAFLPLVEEIQLPCTEVGLNRLCVGIGDIVKADSYAKFVAYTTHEIYAKWLKAVVNQAPPQDLLIPLRAVSSIIEDYEVTIAKLREQITAVYADTATVFEAIVNQYLRQHQAILRATQQQQAPGGPR